LISGEFDAATEFAVRAFQEAEHLPVTGKVAQATLTALGPRIVVNLGRFELVLDRPGQENRRFTIACGAPQFPTPTGKFVVYDMVKDPTWIPPDSPWAKEAKTIPPGPDNPLGTRWIGLDWGGVGIHGTNADWTIGSASSHGCVRMHISEVEELYELVQPGTPVTILGGWEEDPLKQRYWPQ
jgi:lipoprotein-anchoring transpeptidase ErfK/SrfK